MADDDPDSGFARGTDGGFDSGTDGGFEGSTDGGADDGTTRVGEMDRVAYYTLVREAVKDAMLDVIGTVLLVGVGLVLFWLGVAGALTAATRQGPVVALVGVAVALAGVYVAAAALEYAPSVGALLAAD